MPGRCCRQGVLYELLRRAGVLAPRHVPGRMLLAYAATTDATTARQVWPGGLAPQVIQPELAGAGLEPRMQAEHPRDTPSSPPPMHWI